MYFIERGSTNLLRLGPKLRSSRSGLGRQTRMTYYDVRVTVRTRLRCDVRHGFTEFTTRDGRTRGETGSRGSRHNSLGEFRVSVRSRRERSPESVIGTSEKESILGTMEFVCLLFLRTF